MICRCIHSFPKHIAQLKIKKKKEGKKKEEKTLQ